MIFVNSILRFRLIVALFAIIIVFLFIRSIFEFTRVSPIKRTSESTRAWTEEEKRLHHQSIQAEKQRNQQMEDYIKALETKIEKIEAIQNNHSLEKKIKIYRYGGTVTFNNPIVSTINQESFSKSIIDLKQCDKRSSSIGFKEMLRNQSNLALQHWERIQDYKIQFKELGIISEKQLMRYPCPTDSFHTKIACLCAKGARVYKEETIPNLQIDRYSGDISMLLKKKTFPDKYNLLCYAKNSTMNSCPRSRMKSAMRLLSLISLLQSKSLNLKENQRDDNDNIKFKLAVGDTPPSMACDYSVISFSRQVRLDMGDGTYAMPMFDVSTQFTDVTKEYSINDTITEIDIRKDLIDKTPLEIKLANFDPIIKVADKSLYKNRINKLFWAGGIGPMVQPSDIDGDISRRTYYKKLCPHYPEILKCSDGIIPVKWKDWVKYKFVLHLDGKSFSKSLEEQVWLGAALFIQDTPTPMYFQPLMKPCKKYYKYDKNGKFILKIDPKVSCDYYPVNRNISDLPELIQAVQKYPKHAEQTAKNLRKFAYDHVSVDAAICYLNDLFNELKYVHQQLNITDVMKGQNQSTIRYNSLWNYDTFEHSKR